MLPRIGKVTRSLSYHLPTLIKLALVKRNIDGDFDLPIRPYAATINITDRCCLRCIMCSQWTHKNADKELSTDQWKKVLGDFRVFGIERLNFAGGEPLMRKDLASLVSTATDLGMRVAITSNGFFLKRESILELINSGVVQFVLSVDGSEKIHDEIRGVKGSFQKVINAAAELSKLRKAGKIDVTISALIMKNTLSDILNVVSIAEELEIPIGFNLIDNASYFFDLTENRGEHWIVDEDLITLRQIIERLVVIKKEKPWLIRHPLSAIKFIADYFDDPLQKHIPCASVLTRVLVDSEGNVFGGCWSSPIFGNLLVNKISDIYNDRSYRDAHKRLYFKNCHGCSCGYETNLRYFIPALMSDIAATAKTKSTSFLGGNK